MKAKVWDQHTHAMLARKESHPDGQKGAAQRTKLHGAPTLIRSKLRQGCRLGPAGPFTPLVVGPTGRVQLLVQALFLLDPTHLLADRSALQRKQQSRWRTRGGGKRKQGTVNRENNNNTHGQWKHTRRKLASMEDTRRFDVKEAFQAKRLCASDVKSCKKENG